MYYAIIDASSETSRLATIAYGVNLCDIAEWFVSEFRDTFEMYYSGDDEQSADKTIKQIDEFCELVKEGAMEKQDMVGVSFSVDDVVVELYNIYDTFEEFAGAFCEFVSDKPKYVKIKPDVNAGDILAECDRINSLLVRASI